MEKLIRNNWRRNGGEPFARARILSHEIHPEGLDVDRIRFIEAGSLVPESRVGHIISVLRGSGRLQVTGNDRQSLHLEAGVHLYLPPGLGSVLDADPETELVRVSAASDSQARGNQLLLRDEAFLTACAHGSQSLRWILTPQYLSRRIFLYHDPILVSKSGNPVSWFRTTMFNVDGLPENEDGEPAFKMSYNSRTELNVCYDVQGHARVRMAKHPYLQTTQSWGPWFPLDGDSTYHLNEAAGSSEEEFRIDKATGVGQSFRNKHEVYIAGGHVTLFCLFDPAPTGVERHRPGEYSDYEPLAQVLGTESYETHQRQIARYDEMVGRLSLAKAQGTLDAFHRTPIWELYTQGRKAQTTIESELVKTVAGRAHALLPWMQTVAE